MRNSSKWNWYFALACVAAIGGCAADGGSEQSDPGGVIGGTGGLSGAVNNPLMPGGMNGVTGVMPGGSQMPGSQGLTGSMPCAVDSVVKSGCQTCHGATPAGGAPM